MTSAEVEATAVRPQQTVSVSIIHPGNRLEKMLVPLRTTGLDVRVAPTDPFDADVVVQDMINYHTGPAVLRSKMNGNKFVYRMRGDIFAELSGYDKPKVAKWGAKNVIMPLVDGVIAVTDHFAEKYERKTGVSPVDSAGLWKRPERWDVTDHQDDELRMLTLTNANYVDKVDPILEWAPVVEDYCEDRGGSWAVAGRGRHTNRLDMGLEHYDHVDWLGYIDAEEWLDRSNVLLHPSYLDGQPNAILEGMVTGLPVVTTDWVTFKHFDGPNVIVSEPFELRDQLEQLESPQARQRLGELGRKHIETHHTPEVIGQQYVEFFQELVGDE